ncbi:MAG: fructose 1,6-bisphosphatase [Anaerolineae bacterium SM23_ 63]|nr:MAG: fructose 1,6-bisphosphatase [Anaerolineae bacterium SM23_ 63]HEY46932.1 class II fructose-bisphosphatase [Anaerolineae bacterium]
MKEQPSRNLALELTRVTEAAALAAARHMGRGNKEAGDQAAVDAMRLVLNSIEMDGVVVVGEGEKDEAPMLFNGERLGTGVAPKVDIAVDPVDGTRLLAQGRANSISTVALAERGSMFDPGPIVYMHKIAAGPEARGHIDIDASITDNIKAVARAKSADVDDLTVVILERDRHQEFIDEIRRAGARIRLITDGDVSGALMTAWPESGIDLLIGIGGTPEGVLAACALKCMEGEIQGRLYPRNEEEASLAREMGYDLEKVLTIDDLVSSDEIFFSVTGITDGELVQGVKFFGTGARTHSLVMRSQSGTVREITATHRWEKLMAYSQIPYDPSR